MSHRLALAAVLLAVVPAVAVIQRLTPLKDVLAAEQYIFTATVERLDADKLSAVLAVKDDLKGKAPFRKLPVALAGDAEAQKEKQTPQLLDRLAPNLEVVVFAFTRGGKTTAFVFTNGTWVQLTG